MASDLRSIIERYLAVSPTRSISALARRSKVSQSSLRRIMQNEVSSTDFGNILKILPIVAESAEIKTFLETNFPEQAKVFLEHRVHNKVTTEVDEALATALRTPSQFVAVSLAATSTGTTQNELQHLCGARSAKDVDFLLAQGLLQEKGGRLFTTIENFAPLDLEVNSAAIHNCLPFLDQDKVGLSRQIACLHTNNTSVDGLRKIHAIMAKAISDADEILNTEKGDLPVFVGALLGDFKV